MPNHQLIPKHKKLSDSEKKKVFEKYNIDIKSLPKMLINDPMAIELKAKLGDIIEVERESKTAGVTLYYRVIING